MLPIRGRSAACLMKRTNHSLGDRRGRLQPPPSMAYRTFRGTDGRTWRVWTVVPMCSERRLSSAPVPVERERRHRKSTSRAKLGARWAHGWLAFETAGEKRRLAPYPREWATLAEQDLAILCLKAAPVDPPRRLLE